MMQQRMTCAQKMGVILILLLICFAMAVLDELSGSFQ